MQKLLSILFLFILHSSIFGQKVNEDSLKNVIKQTKSDSVKLNALLILGNYLVRHKQDTNGLALLKQGKQIAEKTNSYTDLARYYMMMGNYYQQVNNWAASIEVLDEMKRVSEKIEDAAIRDDAFMKANNNLANIYYFNGDFTGSLEYHLKALEQVENLPHNANSKATLYVNIASDYRLLKLADKAYEYIKKITPLLPEIKDALKISYYYELYQNQLQKNNSEEAVASLQIIKNALETFDLNEGQQLDLTIQYHEQAGQFEMQITQNYQSALSHFKQFMDMAKKTEDDFSVTEAMYHIGWAYDSLKQYNNAISFLKQTFNTAIKLEMTEYALKSAKHLADIYRKVKNDREGFFIPKWPCN